MGSLPDLETSANCVDNQDLYREQVDIEIISTFSFQSGHWLGDIAPCLLAYGSVASLRQNAALPYASRQSHVFLAIYCIQKAGQQ